MALLDKVEKLFAKARRREETTADEMAALVVQRQGAANSYQELLRKFMADGDRSSVIETCRQMYKTDTRAKAVIQTLARDATKGGFQLETKDARALDVAKALVDRLKLKGRLDDWARLTWRDGDSFLEIGVNARMEIARVTRKPTTRMVRNSNDKDEFDDPTRAYYLHRNPLVPMPNDVIWFADWQIVQASWDKDEGDRYGTPLLAAAQTAWKRVKEGELDIAVRRKTRAGIKHLHRLDDADPADLEKYKQMNAQALGNPLAAITDYYMAGDSQLGQLDDVKHHIHTWFLAAPVPEAILGYGTDVDFSVIGHQKEQYNETITEVQKWVVNQFVVPLLERQWLMAGILPEKVEYEVNWPVKKMLTADQLEKIARAAVALKGAGVPPETVARIIARFLPGIEPEELLLDETEQELEAERLYAIAQRLAADMQAEEPEEEPEEENV